MACIINRIDNADVKYQPKKKSPGAYGAKDSEKWLAIFRRDAGSKLFLNVVDGCCCRREPLGSEFRGGGFYRASIGGIINTLRQTIRLESVDELGDVGAHALTAFSEGA